MRSKHERRGDTRRHSGAHPSTAPEPAPAPTLSPAGGAPVAELRVPPRASERVLGRTAVGGFDTTVSMPATADGPPTATAAGSGRLPLGTTLGRYVLLEQVGAGAMGVVYAAYDYGLDRKVAVKVLRDPHAGAGRRDRLMREAQALAKLSHPNVVGVHDLGRHRDQVFIAMEYVDGRTLRRWLAEEPRSLREVLAVFRAAGEGLAAAHAARIVHRDFKPDNVLVDRCGRVRVSDFGLAMIAQDPEDAAQRAPDALPPEDGAETAPGEPGASTRPRLTRTGMLFGTPAYMALEQHRRAGAVDARADQFSFAVALYEAACGAHPFAADTPAQLAENIRDGRLRPPQRRVPRWLLRALQPALAADPDRRYPSMTALLRALRDRRPMRIAVVAAIAALLVLAGIGLFVAGGAFARKRDARAAEAAHGASVPAARLLDGVWGEPQKREGRAAFAATGSPLADEEWGRIEGALDAHARRWPARYTDVCQVGVLGEPQGQASCARCIDDHRADLAIFIGKLRHVTAEMIARRIDVTRLRPPADCKLAPHARGASARETSAAGAQLLARDRELRTRLAYGELDGAVSEGLALVRDADAEDDLALRANARRTLADLHWAHGEHEAAHGALLAAVQIAEAGAVQPTAAEALLELAWLVGEEQGRPGEALGLAMIARGKLAALGEPGQLWAQLHDLEGVLRLRRKELAPAREQLERARHLYEQAYGGDSHQVSAALEHLGALAEAELRFADAAELFHRAREIAESIYGRLHSTPLTYLAEEAKALAQAGRLDEAERLNGQGLELLEESDLVGVMFVANRGLIEQRRGRHGAARATLARVLALTEELRGPDHVQVAEAAAALGRALEAAGRAGEAIAPLRRAADIYERSLGPKHPDTAAARAQLERVQRAPRRPR